STAVPGRVPAGIDRYHALASPRHVRRHRAAVLLAVKNKPLRARDPRAFLTATRHVGVYSVRPGRKDGSAGPNKRIDQGARSLFLPSLVTHSCQRGGLADGAHRLQLDFYLARFYNRRVGPVERAIGRSGQGPA